MKEVIFRGFIQGRYGTSCQPIFSFGPGGKIVHPHSPQLMITIVAIDATAPIGSIHKGGRDAVREICY